METVNTMQAVMINLGTLIAIVGIAFSVTIFSMIALVFLDRGRRWFS